ncbi:MAG: oxidoreductase [Myxococcota bacterium]
MARWTTDDMPDLTGRVMVVTGANSGLGLAATKALAAKGATVVMACRDPGRAEAAADGIRADVPQARLELRALDLASLDSVAAFAADVAKAHPAIDVLMNNAGVMALPKSRTKDGFETQLGTNHLGHFALTLRLLPALEAAAAPRVVVVASSAHRWGRIDFDDLMGEQRYAPWPRYGQSKLANLLFAYELERRLRAQGRKAIAVAAHPGYSATNLQHVAPKLTGSRAMGWLMDVGNAVLAMDAAQGALPQLRAATDPGVKGGEYYGPDGWFELRGWPVRVDSTPASKDEAVARRLWETSEALTGVAFPDAREARAAS